MPPVNMKTGSNVFEIVPGKVVKITATSPHLFDREIRKLGELYDINSGVSLLKDGTTFGLILFVTKKS